jgi:protein-S-isoprenylcysteine O-methyltransferase Ste14
MSEPSAHKSNWETSEVVFIFPFIISIVLQFLMPLPLAYGVIRLYLIPIGISLTVVGVGFIVSARRELAHHGQPTDPGRPTSKIVVSGIFSVSRNPLYFGIVIMLIGIAMVFNMLWILLLLVPEIVICHFVLIFPEERYLSARFGDEYKAYTSSVYRWFGRKGVSH